MSVRTLNSTEFARLSATLLQAGHTVRFCAQGTSMGPAIQNGDLVQVHPIQGREIHRGEIVLFQHPTRQRLLVHRVIRVDHDTGHVVTQGDDLTRPDGTIPRECVLGRVTTIERSGKQIDMDNGFKRTSGLLWIRCGPLTRVGYRVWRGLARRIRRVLTSVSHR